MVKPTCGLDRGRARLRERAARVSSAERCGLAQTPRPAQRTPSLISLRHRGSEARQATLERRVGRHRNPDLGQRPSESTLDIGSIIRASTSARKTSPRWWAISSASCTEPRCSICREPHRDDQTLCTAVAPDAVRTVQRHRLRAPTSAQSRKFRRLQAVNAAQLRHQDQMSHVRSATLGTGILATACFAVRTQSSVRCWSRGDAVEPEHRPR